MRYRLLITDLDGTLLDKRGRVSDANRLAIRRLQAAGIEVIPATGRALRECGHALETLFPLLEEGAPNRTSHAITAGGALVHETADGRVFLRHTLDEATVRAAAGILGEHGHLAHLLQDHTEAGVDYVFVGDHDFDPATEWWLGHLPVTYRRVASIDEALTSAGAGTLAHTVRVSTVALGESLGPVAERMRRELGDRLALQHWPAVTAQAAVGSPTHLLEAFKSSVNKWTAIESLCAHYRIDPAETIAIGDGLNDLEMVREAGLGIAMENADPRVAAVADLRCGHHDRDGFATAADLVLSRLHGK